MQILVYRDTQPQDDGPTLRPWCATTTTKKVASFDADDPRKAAAGLIRWLKMAHDDENERVPYLHAEVEVSDPMPNTDDDPLSDGYDLDDLLNLGAPLPLAVAEEAHAAGIITELPARALAPGKAETRALFDDADPHIVEMWNAAKPFDGMRVPPTWEIRIFTEEG